MRRRCVWTAFVIGVALASGWVEGGVGSSSELFAQSPASTEPAIIRPAAANSAVGVVDIALIFRQHAGFKRGTEQLKQESSAFEAVVNSQRKQISQQLARQKSLALGSAEYRRSEEEIARRISQMQVRQNLKQRELREREAQLYFETYQEVQREIGRLADQYHLALVLRFESQEINANSPSSVMAGVNRQVLYQRNLDLTPHVVSAVNGRSPTSSAASLNATLVRAQAVPLTK
ncbi:MAG: OmpH family outer membrane protein [Pirellulales bacterium]